MRLRHIEVFYAVYSCGTVSGAARKLNVSQPSISKVLHHAEDQLGYPLFQRIRGKMIPTEEAHALFGEVKTVYDKVLSLQNKARNLRDGKSGHIRLAAMPAVGLDILPRAIAGFRKRYPHVTFDIRTQHFEGLIGSLYEQENDIGLAFSPPAVAGIREYDIGEGEFVCVYNDKDFPDPPARLRLEDLKGKEVISIKDSGPLSDILFHEIMSRGLAFESIVTAQTYYIAKNLVGYGVGVAIVDHLTAQAAGPGTVHHTGFDPAIRYTVKGLYAENRPLSKVCERFLDYFRATYQSTLLVAPDAQAL
ncbi:LysR family transcriptional regulator [Luteithermobacter gelatinilyticus]|uniref:LysR family transcriptional regulator n=1 Tax=Luteithermobacter gelatinilyticus TaxID=2582913 RepID=UPI0011073AB1|nr:LysR family transcriptional regulator [Luteithermobacter gelatinilyticus]|tara:strand:- start:9676 stop:10590 length:915 start_codon:yes stop_codon:yes gene_type:complete